MNMREKFSVFFIAGVASLLISCAALAQNAAHFEFSSSAGSSDFVATGRPGSFKIKGVGAGPTGRLEVRGNHVRGVLTLDLNSFDTGMKMRNEHMKTKYLQTDRFPTAKLEIDSATILSAPLIEGAKIDHGDFAGKLTMHGVTRDVHGTFTADYAAAKLSIDANFEVAINDFGITKPSYMGVSVDDKIPVHIVSSAKAEK